MGRCSRGMVKVHWESGSRFLALTLTNCVTRGAPFLSLSLSLPQFPQLEARELYEVIFLFGDDIVLLGLL